MSAVPKRAMLVVAMAALLGGLGCSETKEPGEVPPDVVASDTWLARDGGSFDTALPESDLSSPLDVPALVPPRYVVMTFNVLCQVCDPDNYDPWDERLDYFDDILTRHDPDLVGLQEFIFPQEVEQLRERHPGYSAVFYVAEGSFMDYPDATILFRTSRFELLGQGEFWLSPEPDVPGSTGFSEDVQLPRLVVWARLRDLVAGRELAFATTHFDPNPPSQELSAPLLLDHAAQWAAEAPTIVTGDFNTHPGELAYQRLVDGIDGRGFHLIDTFDLAASWEIDANREPPPVTYEPANRIDHIFVAGDEWRCPRWVADLHVYGPDDRFPSDHWALTAELELGE